MTAITTIRIDHAALPEHFDRLRPDAVAEVIRPAPKGFLANPQFLGEVGAADPALQERAFGRPDLRCHCVGFKLRHLFSPDCRPLRAKVVSKQKHTGRGGRVAVTGSEIVNLATPRVTPCFVEVVQNCAALQRDVSTLQT